MSQLTKGQIEFLTKSIKEGKPIPEDYKYILFPPDKKEYELVYANKDREEDILANTMAVPLQKVKTFGNNGKDWTNLLIFGDNLQILKTIYEDDDPVIKGKVKGKIRLIYIDPPFATRQEFRGSQDQKAYQDKLAGAQFLEFLRKRLIFLREILADDGSIYIHLDQKKGHYIKALMDEIMGENNFLNEVIWYYRRWNIASNLFARNHDNLLFYAKKSGNHTFNNLYIPKSEKSSGQGRTWKSVFDKNGKRHSVLLKEESKGVPMPDTWELSIINPVGLERKLVGYPTQKPEALIERIIKASSNEGDLVMDCFAGSGTTMAVAEKLGRRWIGVDCGKLAIYTMQKRLLNLKDEKKKTIKCKPFTLYNAGLYDYQKIKELPWEQYRKFALQLFQCRDSKHSISGIELDGFLGRDDVMVFNYLEHKDVSLDREFIDDLHKHIGKKIGKRFFIIVPSASVRFLEDYIDKGTTKYFILRIPYSIIEEIHNRGFASIKQPVNETDVNDTVESVGFDFIQIPDIECNYYLDKPKETDLLNQKVKECVIKIKAFESKIISRKPLEFKNLETLSMVMLDYDHDGKVFDIDEVFYAEKLQPDYEVRFDSAKVKEQIMIIYVDIFGNEKKETKKLSDFKKKK